LYNAAVVIDHGEVRHVYRKRHLPNYQVFDEKRYFSEGESAGVIGIAGVPVGIVICEDLWRDGPVGDSVAAGARLVVALNASPFHVDKPAQRTALIARQAREHQVSIVYVNLVGGQDELVFDGGSLVVDHSGTVMAACPLFEEQASAVELICEHHCQPLSQLLSEPLSMDASVYRALVLGVRDYVNKNGFRSVVLGLSGGVDSALTLAIAVD